MGPLVRVPHRGVRRGKNQLWISIWIDVIPRVVILMMRRIVNLLLIVCPLDE
jgi:hypothetical protein